jgi:hypothetical protein
MRILPDPGANRIDPNPGNRPGSRRNTSENRGLARPIWPDHSGSPTILAPQYTKTQAGDGLGSVGIRKDIFVDQSLNTQYSTRNFQPKIGLHASIV